MSMAIGDSNRSNRENVAKSLPIWALLAIIFVMAATAVSNESFWIDECISAEIADQPTLKQVWGAMGTFPEVQLPFYMVYLWTCIHLFGSDEWVLRAINVPWFVAGSVVFIVALGRRVNSAVLPALLVGLSAFAWYYLNEARVYSAQLGFALAFIGAAVGILHHAPTDSALPRYRRILLAALVLLCGSSILGAVWGFFFFMAFVVARGVRRVMEDLRAIPVTTGFSCILLAGLAAYYAWTLTLSSRPTAVGTTNLQTIIFVFYEILGASGLGPGRYELRTHGAAALNPFLPHVLLYLGAVLFIFWQGVRDLGARSEWRRLVPVTLLVLSPLFLIFALGFSTRFRVLGRHITPLLPLLLVVLSVGCQRLIARWPLLPSRAVVGGFLVLSLLSSWSVRFAQRHKKDDYRGASALAQEALERNAHVWWNADPYGAAYYKLRNEAGPVSPRLRISINSLPEDLATWPQPDIIISSKPDSYDNQLAVQSYARKRQYHRSEKLPAFIIWTRREMAP